MKTMTCKQLGGACDKEFHANTFEKIGELSKNHAMQMKEDPDHQKAMKAMEGLMSDPKAFQEWFESKRKEFEGL